MNKITVWCDGGSRGNPGKSASAFVARLNGRVVKQGSEFLGITTNNVAEYSAVILALNWLTETPDILPAEINFILDSQLVVRQLSGVYKVKNTKLKELYETIKILETKIVSKINFVSVSREKNILSDSMVNKELDKN